MERTLNMESLQIRTGQKQLQILDDNGNVRGIFTFNPEDIDAAKRMFDIKQELTIKQQEFNIRAAEVKNEEESFKLLYEIVYYFEAKIDECFGEGTSKVLFGEARTLSMFEDFFTGIAPYYEKASEARKSKYKKHH